MKHRYAILIFVLFCITILITSGCGKEGMSSEEALVLLGEVGKAMEGISSLQMDVNISAKAEYAKDVPDNIRRMFSSNPDELTSFDYQMIAEKNEDGSWTAKINYGPAGDRQFPQSREIYLSGDKAYVRTSLSGWYYYDTKGTEGLKPNNMITTPEEIKDFVANADIVRVIEESDTTITFEMDLSEDYLGYMEDKFIAKGLSDEEIAESMETMRQLFDGSVFILVVDKETNLWIEGKLTSRMEIPEFVRSMDPEFKQNASKTLVENTQGSYVTIEYLYSFSNYNNDFNITIPDEALNASPLLD